MSLPKSVLVLGAGFVGTAACDVLRSRGCTVTATTTTPSRLNALKEHADNVEVVHSGNLDALRAALQEKEGLIVSVAAGRGGDYPSVYLGTAEAVAQMIEDLPNIKHVVYTSSVSVYGDQDNGEVDEDTATSPKGTAGEVLVAAEQTFQSISSCRVTVVRFGELYGPGREIENRLRNASGRKFAGSGENTVNLTHQDDAAGAIAFLLEEELVGVFNVVGDTHCPRKELYDRICDAKGFDKVEWDPTQSSTHGGRRVVSNDKLKDAGYNLVHPTYQI